MVKFYSLLTIITFLGLSKGAVKQPPVSPQIKTKYSVKSNIDKNIYLKEDLTYLSGDMVSIIIQPPICASCYK